MVYWQYDRIEILQHVSRRLPPPSALLLGPPLWRVRHPLRFSLLRKASPWEVEASSPVQPSVEGLPFEADGCCY